MISTPLIVFLQSKACEWLITRIRKEFTSKNTKEKISCGVGRTEEISHQSRMNGAKFALAWAGAKFALA